MNLVDILDPSLKGRTAKTAVKHVQAGTISHPAKAQSYSFGDLETLSNKLANFMADRGVSKGDRVCVYCPNSPWLAIILLATLKLGAIYVPINFLYRKQELEHLIADAKPKLIIADSTVEGIASKAIKPRAGKPLLLRHPTGLPDAIRSQSSTRPQCLVSGDDAAGIFYTSGTTGRSKGAVLTHNNLAFNAMALHAIWQWKETDRLLLSLPLSHLHGMANGLLGSMLAGASLLLLERFSAKQVLNLIEQEQATLFFGVPTMYARLVAPEANLGARNLSSVRLFVSGSAPLAPEIYVEFKAVTGHSILERYGLSEALMVASNPHSGERRPGTVGLPLPGVLVKIVTAAGKEAEAAEEGELWVSGPNVFKGYWRNGKATRQAMSSHWLKSGDIAKLSRDGYITICGRAKELIISGGFNIYPREVEDALMSAPAVKEAAVIGIPDPVKGEVVKAFVVAMPGEKLDWRQLESHCRDLLASFKVPRAWQEVKNIPRNAMGKILRRALSRQADSERDPPQPARQV